MKVLVDEMPKEASECSFAYSSYIDTATGSEKIYKCRLDMFPCDVRFCLHLKPLEQPVKDDCK